MLTSSGHPTPTERATVVQVVAYSNDEVATLAGPPARADTGLVVCGYFV